MFTSMAWFDFEQQIKPIIVGNDEKLDLKFIGAYLVYLEKLIIY